MFRAESQIRSREIDRVADRPGDGSVKLLDNELSIGRSRNVKQKYPLNEKEKLTAVLTYHVVPGKVMAADVVKLDSAKTVQGESITIDTSDGVKVDNAKVVKTDVMASNGVIHVIDTVIMPK